LKFERTSLILAAVLLVGLGFRAVGLDRGTSDFVLPEERAAGHEVAFYAFHPDEISLIDGALGDIELTRPPYTSYGVLPPYLLGGVLRALDLRQERTSLTGAPPDFRRHVYLTARTLAVVFSVGVLLLTASLTRRLYGAHAALGTTALVAVAPGAIQQAHFFITDGPFACASLAALWAILRALDGPARWDRFLTAGALIGLTACIRFNGGLLGLLLVAGCLAGGTGDLRRRLTAVLRHRELWAAGLLAIGLLLTLHPYVFVRPELLSRARQVGDLGLAMKFASGEYLQPWTLVDVDVIPFVSHWFGMWPVAVGWPLTVLFLLALGWALWRGNTAERLLAAWCLIYFLPIGLLPARAVRHLIPLLAILAILGAGALRDLLRSLPAARRPVLVAGSVVGLHLFLCGIAFARVYQVEDSRIAAGRYVANKVRAGVPVLVESGAYSAAHLVSPQRHPQVWTDMSTLLYTGPYMLCADRIDYMGAKLKKAGAGIYVEENRAIQYAAVPELFPVAASFYDRLFAGDFGFDVVQRFKTYPRIAGLTFADDGVDPTFTGYDHPAVPVVMRRDGANVSDAMARWRRDMAANPWCPDEALHGAAVRLRAGDDAGALQAVRQAAAANPNALVVYRIEEEILRRLGRREAADAVRAAYRPESVTGRMAHVVNPNMVHYVTGALAQSLVRLGFVDAAIGELQAGLLEDYSDVPRAQRLRAASYLRVAQTMGAAGYADHHEAAIQLSLQVFRTTYAINALAKIEAQRGNLEGSRQFLEQSILLDAGQSEVHYSLAELILKTTDDRRRALHHLDRALELGGEITTKAATLRQRLLDAGLEP
jgi:tetratricopeptide (TPR) repeat protein